KDAEAFYYHLNNNIGEDQLFSYVSTVAETYRHQPNGKLYTMLGAGNAHHDLDKFLKCWYQHFNLRQLLLFGLTKKEIIETNHNTIDLNRFCLTNPYQLYTLPTDKVNNLVKLLDLKIDPQDQYTGTIVHYLYQ